MFSWLKKSGGGPSNRCTVGLSLIEDRLTLVACSTGEGEKPRIEAWDSALLTESLRLSDVLERFVAQNGLRGRPCRALLPSYDYSLRLIERPPNVPDEELSEATRWLIRDLVEFDVDQAQMAVLLLPEDERRARTERMFVIAAREGSLLETAQAVTDAGLHLAGIEILETTMISLEARMPQTVAGHAVLWLDDKSSALTVSIDQRLLLARSLSIDTTALDEAAQCVADGSEEGGHRAQDLLGPLLLEIQRSLDYYESESGGAPVSQLTLLPSSIDSALIAPLMAEPLRPLTVEHFDIERYFEIEDVPFGGVQADLVLAAGTAAAPPDLLGDALVPRALQSGTNDFGLATVLRIAALVSVMMLGLYGWNYSQLRTERVELGVLTLEQTGLEAQLTARLEEESIRAAQSDPKTEVEALRRLRDRGLRTLRDLNRGNTRSVVPFSHFMSAIARQDLQSLWVERIELGAGGSEIAIQGRTLDAADLPLFLQRLGDEPSFHSRRFQTLDFSRPDDESPGLVFRIATRQEEGTEE